MDNKGRVMGNSLLSSKQPQSVTVALSWGFCYESDLFISCVSQSEGHYVDHFDEHLTMIIEMAKTRGFDYKCKQ